MTSARVLYGDVVLDLNDALHAHKRDVALHWGRWSPMREFDPADVARLAVQDAIAADAGGLPDIWAGWFTDHKNNIRNPRWDGPDEAFAGFIAALRNALLVPLCDEFHAALRDLLDTWAIPEATRRMEDLRRRARNLRVFGEHDWQTADLVAEVEALAGEGRRRGRSVWFHCPFHPDRTASLHVDPERRIWKCFGACGRGGGVLAWRRVMERAA